jgi:hypothetical protein
MNASRLLDAFPLMSASVDNNESNIEDDSNQLAEAYHRMNLAADAN